MKRDERSPRRPLRAVLPLLIAGTLHSTTGCMSWRPMGSEGASFEEKDLHGREVRVTYPNGVVTVEVEHVSPPTVTGVLVSPDAGSGAPAKKQTVTLDLRGATAVEVRRVDPHKIGKTVGIVTASAIGAGVSVAVLSLLVGKGVEINYAAYDRSPGPGGGLGASPGGEPGPAR